MEELFQKLFRVITSCIQGEQTLLRLNYTLQPSICLFIKTGEALQMKTLQFASRSKTTIFGISIRQVDAEAMKHINLQ